MSDDLIYEPDVQSTSWGLVFALIALICLVIGIAAGLFYTWEISPIVEQNTRPDQLREADKLDYVIAIALDYAYKGDLPRAYRLLGEIDPGRDPFQIAADSVCQLTQRGRIQTASDIEVSRYLISIFQGRANVDVNCDLSIFSTSPPPTLVTVQPTNTFPPSPIPVASKTATPTFEPNVTVTIPTPRATPIDSEFEVISSSSFCNPSNSGIIEIRVREANTAAEIPGVEVMVQWNTAQGQLQQRFYTGLKPDRGEGYADFEMEAGQTYRVSLPGRSDLTTPLETVACDDEGTLRSYQVIFQSE